MSVRIFLDVEEAISREVRRITFQDDRTLDFTVLQDTFDPVTGENISIPVEANYYDSSADARQIQYPHFFVKLLRTKEDLTTGRVIPQYGQTNVIGVKTSPKAYERIIYSTDGTITLAGNTLGTSSFKIRKVLPGYLVRVLTGNNIGTYTIATVVPNNLGNHTITVSSDLVTNLSALSFEPLSRTVTVLTLTDLNTVKVGDNLVDFSAVSWTITSINPANNTFVISGVGTPDLTAGAKLTRTGNVFQTADVGMITFIVMDPSKPILTASGCQVQTSTLVSDPEVPLDLYYLIRIDSKERQSHIAIANRMWEEFNPPRTALPTIIRTSLSAEQLLTVDVSLGGSNTLTVKDNSKFNVGDRVFIFDDLTPTKAVNGQGFQTVLTTQVTGKTGTTQLIFADTVPDTFLVNNNTKIVSNAEYRLHMFNFVDHVTKDVEGAQYWSHEFTFWVQVWVNRQGTPTLLDTPVQSIGISGDDIEGNVIYEC